MRGRALRTARSTEPVSSVCTWIEPKVGPSALRPSRSTSASTGAASVSSTGREAPALVHRARIAVRCEHLELEHLDAPRAQLLRGLAHELVRDALAARLGPHVEHVEHASALTGLRRDGETDIVGEQDDVLADRLLQLAQVLVGVVVAPFGVGDLLVERVPELAHEREIVGGCVANHGMRCASNR